MKYRDKSMGVPASPSGQCSKSSAETASGLSANVPNAPSHTPGPWKLFHRKRLVEVQYNGSSCPPVNWMGFDDSARSIKEHVANARLIAAAPDLLAEVKRLRNAIRYSEKLPQASTDALLTALIDKATKP